MAPIGESPRSIGGRADVRRLSGKTRYFVYFVAMSGRVMAAGRQWQATVIYYAGQV